MNSGQTHSADFPNSMPDGPCYHSAELILDTLQLAYHFKLWPSSGHNSFFLLIKENSAILPQLKVGTTLPITYHADDAWQHSEVRETQIQNIIDEKKGRFQGHHRVELAIVTNE